MYPWTVRVLSELYTARGDRGMATLVYKFFSLHFVSFQHIYLFALMKTTI